MSSPVSLKQLAPGAVATGLYLAVSFLLVCALLIAAGGSLLALSPTGQAATGSLAAPARDRKLLTRNSRNQLNSPTAAIYRVDNITDNEALSACTAMPNDCSLRGAIAAANATADNDIIEFDTTVFSSPQTIGLGGSPLTIANNGSLTINGGGKIIVSGSNQSRVFQVNAGAVAAFNDLTITGGTTSANGGGIYSFGTVTVNNSTVSGNSASGGSSGGGISNEGGTLNLTNSTVSENLGSFSGAGVYNSAILNVTNSTISGNTSSNIGGGIRNLGTANLTNSTISGNSASGGSGGGGILNEISGTVNSRNSIIAGNTGPSAPDFSGTLTSQGYNLIGNTTGTTFAGDVTGNVLNQNAQLGPLQDNGGGTYTRALLSASPAINAGNNALAVDQNNQPLTTDQRGTDFARIRSGTVDMGAFEFVVILTVDNSTDNGALSGCTAAPNDCSLRGALTNANNSTSDESIVFDPVVFNTVQTIPLGPSGRLTVASNGSVTINGGGKVIVSGSSGGGVFQINGGANATLNGLTIKDGIAFGSSGFHGGGILNAGTLMLVNSTISGNAAPSGGGTGGGIENNGTLTVISSTISGNNSESGGGGIQNNGTLTVTNSTISGNDAFGGGGSGSGGGIKSNGTLTVTNSAISGNDASASGGGVFIIGGTVNLTSSTVSNNTSGGDGGGIHNFGGTLNLINSTISGNLSSSGAGVFNGSGNTMTVTNSTISDNNAALEGGGIDNSGTVNLTNSTISGNSADTCGGISNSGGTVNSRNSIIAGNNSTEISHDFGGVLSSQGYNLIGNTHATTINGDPTGNILNQNAQLGPLQNNGGPTFTRALAFTSPARNAGSNALALDLNNQPLTTDQRGTGFSRIFKGIVDMGAFEIVQNSPPTISNIADTSTNEDTATGDISFTVGDVETPVADLVVTATSDNQTLVPNANITLGGSGANRTINISPAANRFGTATITVVVSDGDGTAQDTFVLTVNGVSEVFVVDNTSDNAALSACTAAPNDCSLRGAIAGASNDTIEFDAAVFNTLQTITLGGSQLTIENTGPVTINGGGKVRVSANNLSRVFQINSGTNVTINGLTITDGTVSDNGGGILNLGTLYLTNSTISGNAAGNFNGGGISNSGTLHLTNSTISENQAFAANGSGGGIYNSTSGTMTVTNSTISGNQGQGGGGIRNAGFATMTLTNSTVSSNFGNGGNSGGIRNNGTFNSRNSIIAGNINAGPSADFFGTLISQGNNLIGNTDGTTITGVTTGNILNQNAQLGPLQNNGGLTQTHALLPTSPALNAGNNALAVDRNNQPLTTDQRGYLRIVNVTVDMGAFEVNTAPTISSIADTSTNEDTATGNINFTVDDVETPAANLVVTATSSNQTLVPNANITLGGAGANRTINITPALNQSGMATITVVVSDGGLTGQSTFILTVNPVNDSPTISNIADTSTNEDTATGNINFTIGDVETTAGSLTVSATSDNQTLVPNVNISLGGSGADRTINITPTLNQFGSATITVVVSDGAATGQDTFVLTVNSVNDAPTISDIGNASINEDTATGDISFTVDDVETPAANLTVTATSDNQTLVPNANITFGGAGANRTINISPAANRAGTATITVVVSDGGATGQDTFVLTVNPVSDVFVVDNTSDNAALSACTAAPNDCSLRGAIAPASNDTIEFDPTVFNTLQTITLGGSPLTIPNNGAVTINGGGKVRVSANNLSSVFQVNSGANVTLDGFIITGGASNVRGGGIDNSGTLNVMNSIISGNSTGGGFGFGGGGISSNGGTLNVTNSTISGNSTSVAGSGGGGISTEGGATVTITNSTISGNSANQFGGGIDNNSGCIVNLTNSTISGNSTIFFGGGIMNLGGVNMRNTTITLNSASQGGGVRISSGAISARNSIIAGNTAQSFAPDIFGGLTSQGHNLIGIVSPQTFLFGDMTGNIFNQKANLGPLMDNGGPARTHALLWNSPAIDAGDDCVFNNTCSPSLGAALTTDQRGSSRKVDGDLIIGAHVDIGAYERQSPEARSVANGSIVSVDMNDVRLLFPCVPSGGCGGGTIANPEAGNALAGNRIEPENSSSTVSITVIDPGTQPAPPSGYSVGTAPPAASCAANPSQSQCLPAFDVSTTATYTPPVGICFYLPSITDQSLFGRLKVLHTEGNALVDRTTGQNFASKIVCASVATLSPFVIAEGVSVSPTAANGDVSGSIVDALGHPVAGAGVRMNGPQDRLTVTDAEGKYRFDNVETNGFYTVTPTGANFVFSPAQLSFSQLGLHTEATFMASSTDNGLNPLERSEYFVRQQYVDFLGREPDEDGFNFWVNNIESCNENALCREAKRIDTSAAFFLSIEFQQTGYLVYRIYSAAYGNIPNAPVPVRMSEFQPDATRIADGVVVRRSGWEQTLENNQQAYLNEFVRRSRFNAAYPLTITPAEFVDQLFANAGVTPSDTDRMGAINDFGSATATSDITARGRALRRVAENASLARREFAPAFVLMQYFGYLRRNPVDTPEPGLNYDGYNFWLSKLNSFSGNYQRAEMVKAFLSSTEYRTRFSP